MDLDQDNTPARNSLSVEQYSAARGTPVFKHAPYSPVLTPSDFFLKSSLKKVGTLIESMGDVKQNSAMILNDLTKDYFQHCFSQWNDVL